MGSKRKAKVEKMDRNLAELRKLHRSLGLDVLEFSHLHFRICGKTLVDYWPSTGRAWIVGSQGNGAIVSVAEACALAYGEPEMLPEAAQMHMDSMVIH